MGGERTLIAQMQPQIRQRRAAEVIAMEAAKGCLPNWHATPVALEPPYCCFDDIVAGTERIPPELGEATRPIPPEAVVWFRLWVPPGKLLDWERSERVLKQLRGIHHPIQFLVRGNERAIRVHIGCHGRDAVKLQATYLGQCLDCELAPANTTGWPLYGFEQAPNILLRDYYPDPPYFRLLTRPPELLESPLDAVMAIFGALPPSLVGVYQVVFVPTARHHDWNHNFEALTDLEYLSRLSTGITELPGHGQPLPSRDLRTMSGAVATKAHNDKPVFAAAWRLALLGERRVAEQAIEGLETVAGLFFFGGRPLNALTETMYLEGEHCADLEQMLLSGTVYRPGFLVNSGELVGLVHVPPTPERIDPRVPLVAGNPYPKRTAELDTGTPVGTVGTVPGDAGSPGDRVHIPDQESGSHIHLIGRSGWGKSVLMEQMALHNIGQGDGVIVLDPHGDLVERLMGLIPAAHVDRTIYFDPASTTWIPLWNPLSLEGHSDPARVASDLVGAFKGTVDGWGDRLEDLLRKTFLSLLPLPGATLNDAATLLFRKDPDSEALLENLVPRIQNAALRRFWRRQFFDYQKSELLPPQHKLGKLLSYESLQLMLSQPESPLSLRDIMDERKILLADLSGLGGDVGDTMGAILMALIHMAALGRRDIPPHLRRLCHVYCDEAHRFTAYGLEDLLTDARKFKVNLTLAHQHLAQFKEHALGALLDVGTCVGFRVNARDAGLLCQQMPPEVTPEAFQVLERREAIARIGSEVVRFRTLDRREGLDPEIGERIIDHSRAHYCMDARAVRLSIQRHRARLYSTSSDYTEPLSTGGDECYAYEEFD